MRLTFRILWAVASLLSSTLPRAAAADFDWKLPLGFPTPAVPSTNPPTAEKVALGRYLFYDPRMSGNQTQSCGTCHRQALAFTDGLPRGIGSTGDVHPRSSMSLADAAYPATLAWANPLLVQLEQQVLLPMFGEQPVELGLSGKEDELLDRLRADARYRKLFAEAFPGEVEPIVLGNLVKALTSFVRTLISGNSPNDRFVQGVDDFAISLSAQRGARLFFNERLECFHCHGGPIFSVSVTWQGKVFDETSFQNNGLYNIDGMGGFPPDNTGLFGFTRIAEDMGSFRAPTLRNIELTGPYMHDGSIDTLEEVLDHYAAGGRKIESGPYAGDGSKSPYKSGFVRGFTLTDDERTDVLAYLESLTDDEFVSTPRFSDPFTANSCTADCDLNGSAEIADLSSAVDVALGRAPLARCVAADRDGDGTITIEELTVSATMAGTGCLSSLPDSDFEIGSTNPGSGELSVSSGLTRVIKLPLAECLGGIDGTCLGGTKVFRATGPGFVGLTSPAMARLAPLDEGTTIRLETTTAVGAGASLTMGGMHLDALGQAVVVGTGPTMQQEAVWQLSFPADQPIPHQRTFWFKLTADRDSYRSSQPIVVVLEPQTE